MWEVNSKLHSYCPPPQVNIPFTTIEYCSLIYVLVTVVQQSIKPYFV